MIIADKLIRSPHSVPVLCEALSLFPRDITLCIECVMALSYKTEEENQGYLYNINKTQVLPFLG